MTVKLAIRGDDDDYLTLEPPPVYTDYILLTEAEFADYERTTAYIELTEAEHAKWQRVEREWQWWQEKFVAVWRKSRGLD